MWPTTTPSKPGRGSGKQRPTRAVLGDAWVLDGEHYRLDRTKTNIDLDQPDQLLELAERAIALDQFHEASWRLALQAEHALRLRESLTDRYNDLAHALDEQPGPQPTRETRVMYRQLLGQN